jgi:hypothetical protein
MCGNLVIQHPSDGVLLEVTLTHAGREFVSDAQQRLGLVNGAGMNTPISSMGWI